MPAHSLPDRPDLEQLKRQAKDLLHAARSKDPAALARFRALPALSRANADELGREPLALHDAQSVIAREHGFTSWKALRALVEQVTLDFEAALAQFVEAATNGRTDRAEWLLALHPRIADASFHAALLLGREPAVALQLASEPALAMRAGGPRGWEPLLYVCHTALSRSAAADPDGLVAIARRLLVLGADPRARFPWLHHGVRRPALWGAVHVTRLLPLAEALLEAGADPDDGITFPLAAAAGNVPALELLLAHGASVNQPWATDGAATLYAILTWARTPIGVRWLLDHGADPDPVFAGNGESPLHVVARRWDVEIAERLVSRGADVTRRRNDGRTPYSVAELSGNRAVATWLLGQGAPTDLRDVDRLVAACSRGDLEAATALLAARPGLRGEIGPEHQAVLHQAAERGDVRALEAMLRCGFDPNWPDESIGKTALHSAAGAGRPEAVALLLANGASPAALDREFHAPPLVWAAEAARSRGEGSRDRTYAAVGRMLLDAGSPLQWQPPSDEPAEEIFEILSEWRRGMA